VNGATAPLTKVMMMATIKEVNEILNKIGWKNKRLTAATVVKYDDGRIIGIYETTDPACVATLENLYGRDYVEVVV
jgi:hypothetical protein